MNNLPMITEEGQTKVKNDEVNYHCNNKFMCHLSMKLFDMLDHNPNYTLVK